MKEWEILKSFPMQCNEADKNYEVCNLFDEITRKNHMVHTMLFFCYKQEILFGRIYLQDQNITFSVKQKYYKYTFIEFLTQNAGFLATKLHPINKTVICNIFAEKCIF